MIMNVQAAEAHSRSPSADERMRLHRKRRREGYRHVGILAHPAEIEALVAKGYLALEDRENIEALQFAISGLLTQLVSDWVCDV